MKLLKNALIFWGLLITFTVQAGSEITLKNSFSGYFGADSIPKIPIKPTGKGPIYKICDTLCNPKFDELCFPCPASGAQEFMMNNYIQESNRRNREIEIKRELGAISQGVPDPTCLKILTDLSFIKEDIAAIKSSTNKSIINDSFDPRVAKSGKVISEKEFRKLYVKEYPNTPFGNKRVYEKQIKSVYMSYTMYHSRTDSPMSAEEWIKP